MDLCNRSSLKQAYETAKTNVKRELLHKQKVAVEACLSLITVALLNKANNSYEILKVDLVRIDNISKDVLNEVSKELNQLEITHSFHHYPGCQREAPEAYILIKF
jgi:hypothetical protein